MKTTQAMRAAFGPNTLLAAAGSRGGRSDAAVGTKTARAESRFEVPR
ncbi:hypothetical protein [Streptomyces roseolus]